MLNILFRLFTQKGITEAKKYALNLSLSLVFVIAIILVSASLYFDWPNGILYTGVVLLIVSFFLLIGPKLSAVIAKKHQKNAYLNKLNLVYKSAQNKLQLSTNVYDTSWYISLSDEKSSHMSANINKINSADLPDNLSLYHTKGALIWHFLPNEGGENSISIEVFVNWATKMRPRQMINGTLLIFDAFTMVKRAQKPIESLLDSVKSTLREIYLQTGFKVPLHVFLSGINNLDGVAESLHELPEHASLSILLKQQKDVPLNSIELRESYYQLFKELFLENLSSVNFQLNSTFKRKQLLGPFQLLYLKLPISDFFFNLIDYKGMDIPFTLASFHLVDDVEMHSRVNLANAHTLIQINQINLPATISSNLKPRFTFTKAFIDSVLPLASLAPIHKSNTYKYWFRQGFMVALGLFLFSFSTFVAYENYQYNQTENNTFERVLAQYTHAVADSKFSLAEPESIIKPLSIIKNAKVRFEQEQSVKPWYSITFLSSANQHRYYQRLYQQQLEIALVPQVKGFIEKELFVFLEGKEYLQVKNIESHYRTLVSADEGKPSNLIDYFSKAILNARYADETQATLFKTFLNDLFTLGYEKNGLKANASLISLINKKVNSVSKNKLLYQYIEKHGSVDGLIDVRKYLTANNAQLFKFKADYQGYLISELYSQDGLQKISFLPNSVFIQDMIKDNYGLFPRQPTSRELSSICAYLKYTYTNNYIVYWQDVLNNIEINSDVSLKAHLTNLKKSQLSALYQLYDEVGYQVNLPQVELIKEEQSEAITDIVPAESLSVLPANIAALKPATDNEIITEQNELATNIKMAFAERLLLVGDEQQKLALYKELSQSIHNVSTWLFKADNAVIPGKYFFDDFAVTHDYQSFSYLWQDDQEAIVNALKSRITAQVFTEVSQKISGYIENRWYNEVYRDYQQQLARYYPFTNSTTDVELTNFQQFFSANSGYLQFKEEIFSHFIKHDGKEILPTLNKEYLIVLSEQIQKFDQQFEKINALWFNEQGQLSMPIVFKPEYMSNTLASFALQFNQTNITYMHGPQVLQSTSWPVDYRNSQLDVELISLMQQKKQFDFDGVFGIFRMIEQFRESKQNSQIKLPFDKNSHMVINVGGIDNAQTVVDLSIFNTLTLPNKIIKISKNHG